MQKAHICCVQVWNLYVFFIYINKINKTNTFLNKHGLGFIFFSFWIAYFKIASYCFFSYNSNSCSFICFKSLLLAAYIFRIVTTSWFIVTSLLSLMIYLLQSLLCLIVKISFASYLLHSIWFFSLSLSYSIFFHSNVCPLVNLSLNLTFILPWESLLVNWWV